MLAHVVARVPGITAPSIGQVLQTILGMLAPVAVKTLQACLHMPTQPTKQPQRLPSERVGIEAPVGDLEDL